MSGMSSIIDRLLGRPLATAEEEGQRIGVLAGVAILGLDGLSSAAYGPEAAMAILLPLGAASPRYITPVTLTVLALLGILYLSYRQTIRAYPNGGGSYTVARENLGENAGLLAGAALILDYVLNVAVGISAGVGALVSAIPALQPWILTLCLLILVFITIVNLRGIRESGLVFSIPTYLFVGTLGGVVLMGLFKTLLNGGHPIGIVPPPALPPATEVVSLWLLLRAFASGCTAMTGVEAVSNAVNAFEPPTTEKAQATLTLIVGLLIALLAGIAFLSHVYAIGAMEGSAPGYQSVLSQLTAAVTGRGFAYYVTMGAVISVLCLSANTSFAGLPRLLRLLAVDNYLPHAFANRGRRLVYSLGIVTLAAFSAILLFIFGGITDRLIPLFAIGAFLAFTLSQAGMVMHWRRSRQPGTFPSLAINFVGCIATAVALAIILVAKFAEGAWITLLLLPGLLWLFNAVRAHYERVHKETALDHVVTFDNLTPPVVIVPLHRLSTIAEKALRFALELSPDVVAVHIAADEEESTALREQWNRQITPPCVGRSVRLVSLSSPYRMLFGPLLDFVDQVKKQHEDRLIAVIIPELVEQHWWELFLHKQRAAGLKAHLLLRGDNRVIIVNVPWYLGRAPELVGVGHPPNTTTRETTT